MKKIRIYRICTFIILFCFVLDFNTVYASSKDIKVLNARSAIAIDSNTGRILYEKNSEELIPMASTTKVMTALVALKYGKLDEKITISKRSANVSGSTVGYKKDEVITLKELLYGLLLRSGNDAAIAIAEGISGTVEDYLKLMNEYALQMGISGTHFETPHGLDSEFHYTTSYELALIARKAMKEKTFREIVQTKTLDGKAYGFTRSYNNINKILHLIPNANGIKTGYTGNAGKCLVSSIKINNSEIIIVVLNSATRWKETQKIYDYVKENYEFQKLADKNVILSSINIEGEKNPLKLALKEDIIVPIKKGTNFKLEIINPKEVKVPIKLDIPYGRVNIFEDDKIIYSKELYTANEIKGKLVKKWFKF